MRISDVTAVLTALDDAHVRHWVAGGWGVAVLVGRQTRRHRDLDLAVHADDMGACVSALTDLGYVTETDWLPVRLELRAPGRRWVDLHPVAFDATGQGRQEGLDGTHFTYPPSAFSIGSLGGRAVRCVSPRQQREFHTGYAHRSQDVHDLAQLDQLEHR